MARVRHWWSHGKTVVLIWLISAALFFFGFRMAVYSSSRNNLLTDSEPSILNSKRRSQLYDKMARDLDEHGAAFLQGGKTSQSLSLSDIFTLKDGSVTPVLKPANPPVRANVLYLSPEFSEPISQAVTGIFLPYFDKAIWFQNSSLYHFSMFHASHHITPIPATKAEIETEENAIKAVAKSICPLKIILDRVVLTSTGVLLGCWQVISGTDPLTIRAKLRSALPHAPEKQLYDPAMLHTSFARLLGQPKMSPKETQMYSNQLEFFHEMVNRLNSQLRGFKNSSSLQYGEGEKINSLVYTDRSHPEIGNRHSLAEVSELWYVEEFDVLALALNGRIMARRFHLGCLKT